MDSVTPELVNKLSVEQIHSIAMEQFMVMETPQYQEAESKIKDFRGGKTEEQLVEAFNSTSMVSVVEDYTLEAVVVAALAMENKDKLSDPELELLTYSWNQGRSIKKPSGSQIRPRR